MPAEVIRKLMPLGNALCLNFANTAEPRGTADAYEFLTGYDDLIHWSVHVGAMASSTGAALRNRATREPRAAAATFRKALVLREAISNVFEAVAEGAEPDQAALDAIDRVYKTHLARTHLTGTGEGFGFASADEGDLASPLWPVVDSAVELLTHGDLSSIKYCAGDCRWLFLDVSKNHSRRWCTMAACGSRDKMRRHYARHHADGGART